MLFDSFSNYASLGVLSLAILRGRLTPYVPLMILPRFDFLSPLPIFLILNFLQKYTFFQKKRSLHSFFFSNDLET